VNDEVERNYRLWKMNEEKKEKRKKMVRPRGQWIVVCWCMITCMPKKEVAMRPRWIDTEVMCRPVSRAYQEF